MNKSNTSQPLESDYVLILTGDAGWHIAFKRFGRVLGIGQKTIARRMAIHPTMITKWEHVRSQPTRETRERALAAIGLTPPRQPDPFAAPPPEVEPNTVHVRGQRQISTREYAPDWKPQRAQPLLSTAVRTGRPTTYLTIYWVP